ncbi:MAG: AI-2E family transporter [Planctomycetota bacterium]|nr:AI-2E family transporter [Planctomycetota bacterium]
MDNNKYRRLISFLVLLAIIILSGALFYQVMASFVLPLFLATVLVVVFAPVHNFILKQYNAKPRLAALTTTSIIGLVVLLPIVVTITFAIIEGSNLVGNITPAFIADSLAEVRHQFKLDIPNQPILDEFERELDILIADAATAETPSEENLRALESLLQLVGEIPTTDNSDGHLLNQLEALETSVETVLQSDEGQAMSSRPPPYLAGLVNINERYNQFKTTLLGGTLKAAIVEAVNPTPEQISQYSSNFFDSDVRNQLLSVGANTLGFSLQLIAGIVIMLVGTYFFLIDGSRMVQSITKLSPLKQDYEDTLIEEFVSISRAVVIATLLSALAQGILAGLGFWVAGLQSVMMLTVAATLLALVPFIGAAAVWAPCAAYLIVFGDSPGWGVFLLIWGIGPVSMADNIVKPFILQNKSKLHPMLALLSVVGGVQALGPIGILTGPMVVVFLQTLLNILHRELSSIDDETQTVPITDKTPDTAPTDPAGQNATTEKPRVDD